MKKIRKCEIFLKHNGVSHSFPSPPIPSLEQLFESSESSNVKGLSPNTKVKAPVGGTEGTDGPTSAKQNVTMVMYCQCPTYYLLAPLPPATSPDVMMPEESDGAIKTRALIG